MLQILQVLDINMDISQVVHILLSFLICSKSAVLGGVCPDGGSNLQMCHSGLDCPKSQVCYFPGTETGYCCETPCLFGLTPVNVEACGGVTGRECVFWATCVYSGGSTRGVCCRHECPNGNKPLENSHCGGLSPKINPCPPGYVCHSNPNCCDLPGTCCENPCPRGSHAWINDCNVIDLYPPCPAGYVCKGNLNGGAGVCCSTQRCPAGTKVIDGESCGGFAGAECPKGSICVYTDGSTIGFCCGCDDDEKNCAGGTTVRRNPNKKCRFNKCPALECQGTCRGNDECEDAWYCNWPEGYFIRFCCPITCQKPKGLCMNSDSCPEKYYCHMKKGFVQGDCCKNPCITGEPTGMGCAEVETPCPEDYTCNEQAFEGLGVCCKNCGLSKKKTTICAAKDGEMVCASGTCKKISKTPELFQALCMTANGKEMCCKLCAKKGHI